MIKPSLPIILVEDEESAARVVMGMLAEVEGKPFRPVWAKTMAEFYELAAKNNFAACLLDLNLPDSIGWDTVSRVKEHSPELPIVVLTGLEGEQLAHEVLVAGAQCFFSKLDINTRFLSRIINNAIEKKRLEIKLLNHTQNLEKIVEERTCQLEMANERMEQSFQCAPDQVMIIGNDYKIIQANKLVAHVLNKPIEEIDGNYCFNLFHQKDQPFAGCPHAAMMKDGKEHQAEIFEPTLNKYYLVSVSPLRNADGDIWGGLHVARDITSLKIAEQRLRESAYNNQMILENLPDPTIIYDMDGNVKYINASFQDTFGWTREEIIKGEWKFVPEEAQEETRAKVEEIKAGRALKGFETSRLTKNGDVLDVLINTSPLLDEDGHHTKNIVLLHDITDMKKALAAQRASDKRFRNLVDTMNEGLIMVDTELRINYCNVRFEQMMGYTKEEIINKPYTDFFDEKNRKIVDEKWRQRVAGEDHPYEIAFLKKDGTTLFAIVTPKVMLDNKGDFIGSFATVTNITEQKILQSQLFQAHKLEGIGQLAAGIAHEINTPTQYVSSNTKFLSDAFSDLQELLKAYQDLADELKSEGLKAEKLKAIDELMQDLDYEFLAEEMPKALEANKDGLARIGKIVLSIKEFAHPGREVKEPTDINKAIINTITVAKNEWKYVADVETDLDEDLPLVNCVASELNQVILNLIVNAAQAIGEAIGGSCGEKGKIIVFSRLNNGWAEIRISDNGPGITPEIRNRIFEPFFTTKEPGKGTGQGLAIAYRSIVDNHKGRLEVESELNKGTTFIIALPLESGGDEVRNEKNIICG